MNILDADHPQLFKKWFEAPTWEAWRAFLAALFALPMSEQQLGILTRLHQAHSGAIEGL